MGAKKVLTITGAVIAVLAVGAVATVFVLAQEDELDPYVSPLSAQAASDNEDVLIALLNVEIDTAHITIANGVVEVIYAIPETTEENANVTAQEWQESALLAAAAGYPNGTTTTVIQVVDDEVAMRWSAPTETIIAYLDDEITVEELEAAISKAAA